MSNIEYWSIALETLFPSLEESIRSGRAQVNMVNIGAGWKYSDWFYADLTSNFDSNGNECYADGLWAKPEELSPTDYVTDSGIDIDLIINRTLVYAALSAMVVALYTVIVGGFSTLFGMRHRLPLSLLATGVTAVAIQPLRARLQRGVDRLLYGERDDPVGVLTRLGQQIEENTAPDSILPALVETAAQALKLPYVAIALTSGDSLQMAAEHPPTSPDPLLHWPANGAPPQRRVRLTSGHVISLAPAPRPPVYGAYCIGRRAHRGH